LYVWVRTAVTPTLRRLTYLAIGILLGLTLLFGNRGLVMEPVLVAVLTFHYVRRRLSLRLMTIMALAGILFLSLGGLYRDVRQYGPAHVATVVSWGFPRWSLPLTYIYSYIRDPVLTFHRLRGVVPAFEDFGQGRVHLAPLATALPGHQESPDDIFKRLLKSEFVGFGQPATLLGHLYVDGGLVAIIAGMYVFGLLSRIIYSRMRLRPSPFRVLLYVWVAHVALWSLFTSLLPAITTLFVPLLLYVLVASLSFGQRPALASAPT
jgi:oligosaccharide repeat unit polymerase